MNIIMRWNFHIEYLGCLYWRFETQVDQLQFYKLMNYTFQGIILQRKPKRKWQNMQLMDWIHR